MQVFVHCLSTVKAPVAGSLIDTLAPATPERRSAGVAGLATPSVAATVIGNVPEPIGAWPGPPTRAS